VIGVDVHKQSLTAVAVDEAGRALAESTASAARDLLARAMSLPGERSWAVEDCRQLTRALERALLAAGESLVRVPPKLMAPQRRAGRARGKSDPIDALAVARAALREPRLDHPRPGEQRLRELKLLVDHRDDLIDERRHSSGCAGTCATSSWSWRSRSVRSTAASGSTGLAAAWQASSSPPRCGSRASSSAAAAA
jgi:transposase